MRQGSAWVGIILVALIAGLAGGVVGVVVGLSVSRRVAPPSPLPVRRPSLSAGVPKSGRVPGGDAVVQARDLAASAVVRVDVESVISRGLTPFDWFFGGPEPQVAHGVGSGVVFEYEGRPYVLTNDHVVGGADSIKLRFYDGTQLAGQVVNTDETEDLAVVRLEQAPASVPVAELGDSDNVRVGQWVLAIGNPYGLQQTVTVGIVSAKGYLRMGENLWRDRIQTDAAINEGNSGGPLIDLSGKVVGINQAIFSPTGATVGIGYAIPINKAKDMLYYLVHRGPWIGVGALLTLSKPLAQYLNLSVDSGVLVYQVVPRSPAAVAGLRPGDVILAINGRQVTTAETLQTEIRKLKIADVATLTIDRRGQRMNLNVTMGKIPDDYR